MCAIICVSNCSASARSSRWVVEIKSRMRSILRSLAFQFSGRILFSRFFSPVISFCTGFISIGFSSVSGCIVVGLLWSLGAVW